MKGAATFFSWLGGIGYTILGFVLLSRGQTVAVTTYNYNYYYGYSYPSTSYTTVAYPAWVWVLWVIFLIFRLIILIWRQTAVSEGKKVGCGVCTLLFVSLLGGIFTLAIPDDQLYGTTHHTTPKLYGTSSSTRTTTTTRQSSPSPERKYLTWEERNKEVEVHRAIYEKGVITKAEFDKRVREIDSRTINRPIPQTQQVQVSAPKPTKGDFSLSEDEIADLIKKYKRLLDDGAITLEEYNQKKQELLDLK